MLLQIITFLARNNLLFGGYDGAEFFAGERKVTQDRWCTDGRGQYIDLNAVVDVWHMQHNKTKHQTTHMC